MDPLLEVLPTVAKQNILLLLQLLRLEAWEPALLKENNSKVLFLSPALGGHLAKDRGVAVGELFPLHLTASGMLTVPLLLECQLLAAAAQDTSLLLECYLRAAAAQGTSLVETRPEAVSLA